ncbi:MAG TPA: TolC family protein, partial [Burkholderiales bacterium]|nr:TolC family protein [Burkholderiales bacterium]
MPLWATNALKIWLICFQLLGLVEASAQDQGYAEGASAKLQVEALTLGQAEQLMLARNHDLQLARRASEAAQAAVISAGARPNPNLTVSVGSINPSLGVGAGGPLDKTVDANARLDQLIERGDKRALRMTAARSLEVAAYSDYFDKLRQMTLTLRQAYYDALLAQERLVIANDMQKLFEGSVEAAEKRFRAGDIAASDVSRLRVDALRAANDARSAEADLRRAQGALALLMNVDAYGMIKAVSPWPDLRDVPGDIDADNVITARADVRAAQARVEAARTARELARA